MEFIMNNLMAVAFICVTVVSVMGATIGLVWKIATWKTDTDARVGHFSRFVEEVRDDIKKILWALNPETRPIEKKSPLRLTEYGMKMAQEMKADEILLPYIARLIDATKEKTVYGIQEECLRFARHDLMGDLHTKNKQQADSIEIYAFQKGISLYEALEVLGVALRDKVFAGLNLPLEE